MAKSRFITDQPDKLDYASPTQFKFEIQQLPKVQFFNVSCNLPGVSMSATIQETPTLGRDIPIHGSKVEFEEFTMSFMVDEYLENYRELHAWLMALGFPQDKTTDRKSWVDDVSRNPDRDASQSQKLYSDATLFILSNKNNPITKIHFYDMFPLSLSGLDYRQDATDVEYMQANATFAYMIYEFEDV
jgi:hypothetical protein